MRIVCRMVHHGSLPHVLTPTKRQHEDYGYHNRCHWGRLCSLTNVKELFAPVVANIVQRVNAKHSAPVNRTECLWPMMVLRLEPQHPHHNRTLLKWVLRIHHNVSSVDSPLVFAHACRRGIQRTRPGTRAGNPWRTTDRSLAFPHPHPPRHLCQQLRT